MIDKIKKLCKEQGTSLNAVEIALHFPKGSISKMKFHRPSIDKVKAMADHFGVTVDELISEEGKD